MRQNLKFYWPKVFVTVVFAILVRLGRFWRPSCRSGPQIGDQDVLKTCLEYGPYFDQTFDDFWTAWGLLWDQNWSNHLIHT